MLTGVIIAVLSYLGGCATYAAECLRLERKTARQEAEIRRLALELADAKANQRPWQ